MGRSRQVERQSVPTGGDVLVRSFVVIALLSWVVAGVVGHGHSSGGWRVTSVVELVVVVTMAVWVAVGARRLWHAERLLEQRIRASMGIGAQDRPRRSGRRHRVGAVTLYLLTVVAFFTGRLPAPACFLLTLGAAAWYDWRPEILLGPPAPSLAGRTHRG